MSEIWGGLPMRVSGIESGLHRFEDVEGVVAGVKKSKRLTAVILKDSRLCLFLSSSI